jgi:hypothetical protein
MNWLLHYDDAPSNTSLFTKEFLTKNNTTLAHSHPTFLFPQLKGCHFDTTEVMKAELQAVLNSLTEHDF